MRYKLSISLLLLASSALAAGSVDVMDPITRLGKRIIGGTGISISGNTITATGAAVIEGSIPFANISSGANPQYVRKSVFTAYTTASGGRATNDRVDIVQGQVTAQAVGAALGATAIQPAQFNNFSTAQAAQDAAQDAAIAALTGVDAVYTNVTDLWTDCTSGYLKFDGTCSTPAGGGGVSSVGLSLPAEFSVSGSPVTTTGTLTGAWASGAANRFLATPNGTTGIPSLRAIVAADIPTLNQSTTGNAATATALAADPTDCSAGQYATTIAASGNLACAQVSYSQISSTPTLAATITCGGTDKISAYNATTGSFTCSTDQTGAGGSGITTLNTLTAATQTFADVDDTNVTLAINSATSTHTFTLGWTGTLADGRIASASTWNAKQAALVSGTNIKTVGGVSLLGSGDLGIIGAAYGGTGNGFTAFTGPTTSTKTFTLPDANATLLYSGGPLGTPSGGTLTNATGLPVSTGISGLGTGVATALGNTLGGAGGVTTTIASGTSALGTGAISSGACATVVTTAATGVATTDVINWGFNGDPTSVTGYQASTNGMLTIIAYPTANNVNYKVCNNTGSSITPGAITLNWRVFR